MFKKLHKNIINILKIIYLAYFFYKIDLNQFIDNIIN